MSGAGDPRPPRVLRALLARILPPGRVQDGLAGDLDELYAERVQRRGRARANAWYARQLLSAAFHYRLKRPRSLPPPEKRSTTRFDSLARDLAYALRNLRRAGLRDGDRAHARAGHRREHGDLHAAGRGRAAAAAGAGAGAAPRGRGRR